MFKKLLYNYRMRKLRKYYIDYTMKHSSNSINAFCYVTILFSATPILSAVFQPIK